MKTEIFVISGFLGAGKTTLIQKLLKEAFSGEKVVLIENDFGDISVDAALLSSGSVEVKEINSGCICCSLSGDFIIAMKGLLERFHPDKIIIEPSGVGKLSDIVKACSDPRVSPLSEIKGKITVADVNRCKMYLYNFGEFFEDQIQNADIIVLSHTDDGVEKTETARLLLSELNPKAPILAKPWEELTAAEILYPNSALNIDEHEHEHEHEHGEHCQCGCHGHHHDHAHSHEHKHEHGHDHEHGCGCGCGHDHTADEIFDTVTVHTNRVFREDELKERMSRMEQSTKATVIRAKGIVRSPHGHLNLQYIPGDIQITDCSATGDMICFIGCKLNKEELTGLFS